MLIEYVTRLNMNSTFVYATNLQFRLFGNLVVTTFDYKGSHIMADAVISLKFRDNARLGLCAIQGMEIFTSSSIPVINAFDTQQVRLEVSNCDWYNSDNIKCKLEGDINFGCYVSCYGGA